MQDSESNLGILFMSLPPELRIHIYERVFNAGFDNSLLPSRYNRRFYLMQKAMLRTLHINQTIRKDSKGICTNLAKLHLEALEASIPADKNALDELVKSCSLHWRCQSFDNRIRRISDLNRKISDDTKKVTVLSELLRILETPRGSRHYVSWLNMCRRLRVLYRDAKQKLDPSVRKMVDGRR